MTRPPELDSEEGGVVWNALTASATGDTHTLRRLLDRDPRLGRAEYWYTPAIHFAAREGHLEAVQLLLDAGADPEWNGLHDGSLIAMARERGHAAIVQLLEAVRDRRGRVPPGSDDYPIHAAIAGDDTAEVQRLLDADPGGVGVGNAIGASPLHRAVGRGLHTLAALLLDRGSSSHRSSVVPCRLMLYGYSWDTADHAPSSHRRAKLPEGPHGATHGRFDLAVGHAAGRGLRLKRTPHLAGSGDVAIEEQPPFAGPIPRVAR